MMRNKEHGRPRLDKYIS